MDRKDCHEEARDAAVWSPRIWSVSYVVFFVINLVDFLGDATIKQGVLVFALALLLAFEINKAVAASRRYKDVCPCRYRGDDEETGPRARRSA